jgi:protein-ribulosamine 3-kinase
VSVPETFFIKVTSKDVGKQMVHREFGSSIAIYKLLPEFVPKPSTWGSYQKIPETYFFLCHFKKMTKKLLDPKEFAVRLETLHRDSKSPIGKFGFYINNCVGNLFLKNDWDESWEKFFSKNMRHTLELELAARGPEPEFETLVPALFEKVIYRVYRGHWKVKDDQ